MLQKIQARNVEKMNFVINVFSFLTQNLNPTGLDRKLETSLESDYAKMVWNTCVPHKFTRFIYLKDNFIELSQPYITYQKAKNIVVKLVEEDVENLDFLKSALRNHLRTIKYVSSLLFPKIYNRTNRFGINNKSHFDFISNNWEHYKNNRVLPKPTKNRVVEQPTKKVVPEIDKTQLQQQQNEQRKEEILEVGKRPESYEKRFAHPFFWEQKPEKINEVVTPLLPPPPPPATPPIAPSKSLTPAAPIAKSLMYGRFAKRRAEKNARFQKQLNENTEKMNLIKKQKLS